MKDRPFIPEDSLLESEVARDLYHGFAERLPILDYQCHLPRSDREQSPVHQRLAGSVGVSKPR